MEERREGGEGRGNGGERERERERERKKERKRKREREVINYTPFPRYEQTCTLLETRKAHIMKQQAAMTRSTSTQKLSKSIKKNKVELINGDGSGSTPPASRTPSSINPEASVFLAKTLGGDSSEHTDGESDTNVLKSRQFIYKELLATEKVYIEDLKVVLNVSLPPLSSTFSSTHFL